MTKSAKDTGRLGEELAANFLLKNDYKIIERNYRWARGEIDIIAQKEEQLVFIEVKTARSKSFGAPQNWVTEHKQQQIGLVAQRYLQEQDLVNIDCRFDVIAITTHGDEYQIKHFENAFWL